MKPGFWVNIRFFNETKVFEWKLDFWMKLLKLQETQILK